jgi:hypothetical protein
VARIRWAPFVLTAALLVPGWGGRHSAARPTADGLEGTWVIESVQKDGEPDPVQVGGYLTFADGSVILQPAAVQFSDAAMD